MLGVLQARVFYVKPARLIIAKTLLNAHPPAILL
jgi:hypothetical protein